MAAYDARMVTVATAGGFAQVRVMGANPHRLTLTFAQSGNSQIFVSNRDEGGAIRAYHIVSTNVWGVMSARDFGPLIQDEVWISTQVVVASINVVEIFRVR